MEEVDVSFEELLQQEETIVKMEEVDEEVGVRVRVRLSLRARVQAPWRRNLYLLDPNPDSLAQALGDSLKVAKFAPASFWPTKSNPLYARAIAAYLHLGGIVSVRQNGIQ